MKSRNKKCTRAWIGMRDWQTCPRLLRAIFVFVGQMHQSHDLKPVMMILELARWGLRRGATAMRTFGCMNLRYRANTSLFDSVTLSWWHLWRQSDYHGWRVQDDSKLNHTAGTLFLIIEEIGRWYQWLHHPITWFKIVIRANEVCLTKQEQQIFLLFRFYTDTLRPTSIDSWSVLECFTSDMTMVTQPAMHGRLHKTYVLVKTGRSMHWSAIDQQVGYLGCSYQKWAISGQPMIRRLRRSSLFAVKHFGMQILLW